MKEINLGDHPELLNQIFGHFNEYEIMPCSIGGVKIGRIVINKTMDFPADDIGKIVEIEIGKPKNKGE